MGFTRQQALQSDAFYQGATLVGSGYHASAACKLAGITQEPVA